MVTLGSWHLDALACDIHTKGLYTDSRSNVLVVTVKNIFLRVPEVQITIKAARAPVAELLQALDCGRFVAPMMEISGSWTATSMMDTSLTILRWLVDVLELGFSQRRDVALLARMTNRVANQAVHLVHPRIPTVLPRQLQPALHALAPRVAQRLLSLRDTLLGVVREVDNVAPLLHDAAHARADDRPASGHVFQRLGRVDEPGGGVESEAHHAYVERGAVVRRLLVIAAAHPEEVRRTRKQFRIDLHDRPDHHERPVGAQPRHLAQQVVIDTLVHHAYPTQDRARHGGDLGRDDSRRVLRFVEVIKLHAAPEDVDIRVLLALLVAQFVAAGKDDVCVLHEPGFVCGELLWRAGKLRELAHAVVDDATVLDVAKRPGAVHRAVIPEQRLIEGAAVLVDAPDGFLGQFAQEQRHLPAPGHRLRRVYAGDGDVRHDRVHLDVRLHALGAVERGLFDKEDWVLSREPQEEPLRLLPDEAPVQVREDDNAEVIGRGHVRL